MQFAIVGGVGGGCGGGRHTQKTTNIKRWGWDQSSEVRTLFEGDPARLGHPLCVVTENKCRGCSSYTAQPASQCLHRSSVSRIGNAAARGATSCKQSFFWKRSMDGGDRYEAAEHTIHVQLVKGARSQTRNSQTGITLQCIAYCNKEHSHQSICSLYTGGNLADAGSLELPQWNPPASWSLPWALRVHSDLYAAVKLSQF